MAKATGFIFTVQHCFSTRGTFWHTTVRPMYSLGTYQCLPSCFILLTVKSIDLVVACDGFLCVMEIVYVCGYLDYRGAFKQSLIRTAV